MRKGTRNPLISNYSEVHMAIKTKKSLDAKDLFLDRELTIQFQICDDCMILVYLNLF